MDDVGKPEAPAIRAEAELDHAAIRAVVGAAFASDVEPRLVDLIRASPNFVAAWSLVAERDGAVVGHVMASYVEVVDGATTHRVPSLSPLAVAPKEQRRGIGSALVRALVARVDAAGEPLLVLEGDPAYYGRFGFVPARDHGITITLPAWATPEAAQVLSLRNDDRSIRGHVRYPPAFDAVAH